MNEYRHHVSGFFVHREEAESALSRLVEQGLLRERIQIYVADSTSSSPAQEAKSDGVLQDVLVDGAIGTAVGTGVGALGSVALAATSVTLFIASPLVAPLMLLGWGASIGGLIGAAAGATSGSGNKEGWLSDLVSDAIANGQVVLVAETRNEQETANVREVIKDSVGKYKDTNMAVA
jgi:hypothetical protein